MGRLIQPARSGTGTVSTVQSVTNAASQSYIKGAPLYLVSGLATEMATPSTSASKIFGFALEDYQSRPGYNAANSPTVVTGRNNEVSLARATRVTVFSAQLVNNSAVAIAPVAADMGVDYGLKSYSVSSNNEWYVDKNIVTTAAPCEIVDIDTDQNIVYFKVRESFLASP